MVFLKDWYFTTTTYYHTEPIGIAIIIKHAMHLNSNEKNFLENTFETISFERF